MHFIARLSLLVCLLVPMFAVAALAPAPANPAEELQHVDGEVGRYGGHLGIGQRAEPKTLNPVTATDAVSRQIIGRLIADFIPIHRATPPTTPPFPKSLPAPHTAPTSPPT